ncbi:MAG: cob(I)yrinic acid a,c-diamide adenosyltransferase [Prevotella sp.]|nr:cob(I)yrinic acid a,c-diamide adenosyltransferase [Prevotella sp.]MDO4934370.1 cob(I)yrinic acid a,c-diamide adenosyltransferase [Prevotella sp.]
MKITKVYTKTGDNGTTSLVGGIRIGKADIRLEAYGTVDELNSHLGLLAALLPADDNNLPDSDDRRTIEQIQSILFNVGTHLATDLSQTPLYPSARLPEGATKQLEEEIDRTLSLLPEAQGFVLPGGTPAAAQAHVCRTVCRRAERRVVALAAEAEVGLEIQTYLNRLSDYLFVLAKKLNFIAGESEKMWHNPCE